MGSLDLIPTDWLVRVPAESKDEKGWNCTVGSQIATPLEMVGLDLVDGQGKPGLRGSTHPPRMGDQLTLLPALPVLS